MQVFLTGGTGSIGTAVLKSLIAHGHTVTALTRSQSSRQRVVAAGATPYAGDLRAPDDWVRKALTHDAIIHTACTFDHDMAAADNIVVTTLLSEVGSLKHRPRVLYTGGCWLYGETGDAVAEETRPFAPPPAFAWMVRNADRLLSCDAVSTAVIHPAMVYHEEGGAFDRFIEAARGDRALEIWGAGTVRWPIIHRNDLAEAFASLVSRSDLVGHFNAVAEPGVPVRDIADHIRASWRRSKPHVIIPRATLIERHGDWALGPCLDQQMSGDKLQRLLGWRPQVTDFRQSVGSGQPSNALPADTI